MFIFGLSFTYTMMSGIENYLLFFTTALIFVMTPGIDTVFVLNKSLGEGRIAGIYSTLGINCGILAHTLFSALGLSMIIAQSAMVFTLVKYLGALYLIFLGITALRSKKKLTFDRGIIKEKSSVQNFYAGFITNILNPKVALFFLSLFPQFIKKEYIDHPVPFITLGATYALLGIIWLSMITYSSSLFLNRLKKNPGLNNWINKITGSVYILMGIKMVFTRR